MFFCLFVPSIPHMNSQVHTQTQKPDPSKININGFDVAKSAAQLLYGPVLVVCHIHPHTNSHTDADTPTLKHTPTLSHTLTCLYLCLCLYEAISLFVQFPSYGRSTVKSTVQSSVMSRRTSSNLVPRLLSPRQPRRLRLAVVGPGGCGKSALACRLVARRYITEYCPVLEGVFSRELWLGDTQAQCSTAASQADNSYLQPCQLKLKY